MNSKSFDELEWYLGDYFFKNEKIGIYQTSKNEIELANNLITKYFRFREYKPEELFHSLKILIEKLTKLKVIKNFPNNNIIEISNIERFQCSECYLIYYISEMEKNMF
ncbi:MAG: hypothetical protein ACPKPY_02995 [Nitrososphaeraceae archaeon]